MMRKKKPAGTYERIYAVVRRIPRGRVATYGQIARLAGLPGHARQVGYALHNLPEDSGVPWQRVINARGQISLSRETLAGDVQQAMLEEEGISFSPGGIVSLTIWQWKA